MGRILWGGGGVTKCGSLNNFYMINPLDHKYFLKCYFDIVVLANIN